MSKQRSRKIYLKPIKSGRLYVLLTVLSFLFPLCVLFRSAPLFIHLLPSPSQLLLSLHLLPFLHSPSLHVSLYHHLFALSLCASHRFPLKECYLHADFIFSRFSNKQCRGERMEWGLSHLSPAVYF